MLYASAGTNTGTSISHPRSITIQQSTEDSYLVNLAFAVQGQLVVRFHSLVSFGHQVISFGNLLVSFSIKYQVSGDGRVQIYEVVCDFDVEAD